MTADLHHDPVMLAEVLQFLEIQPGDQVVDGTLGLAGHARVMLERALPGGALLATDWDQAMLNEARAKLAGMPVVLVHGDYRCIPEVMAEMESGGAKLDQRGASGWQVVETSASLKSHNDAILLDLGLNSAQIDDPSRGISFLEEGPLEMRMDRSKGESAAAFLNRASEDQIERVLREYGEERWSRRIAKIILERRKKAPLKTTADLVECVLAAVPAAMRDKRLHPATRTFQGLRIHVNGELEDLDEAIEAIALTLAPGGRMVVLAYHSLEDRAVKNAFRRLAEEEDFEERTRKPLVPTAEEVARNRRSRSAKLRAIKRRNLSAEVVQG